MLNFQKLSADYQQALLRQAVPFWVKNSCDKQCGGYFDMLSAAGEPIQGDKFVALQAQQAWAFSWLYNSFDGQPNWLAHARHGIDFLSQFAHDDMLNCYTQLDRRGRPVAPHTSIVPDSFVVMAYAQFYQATGEDEWALLAKQTFTTLSTRWDSIRLEQTQNIGDFRNVWHLSEPTTALKALLESKALFDEEVWKETVEIILQRLLREFLDRRTDALREHILPEGGFMNTPEGRRLNVGLIFQTVGFLLDLCAESGNRKLAIQVTAWCLKLCEQAWDEAASGLNEFIDAKGEPLIVPATSMKWAWVQLEAITSLLKGYFHTHHPDCPKWFKRIHDYTFETFPDSKQTGWHLAVDTHKQPLLNAKAIPTIGCFSLIRCLAESAQLLTKCGQLQPVGRHVRVV
ncbi:AGE family epimerase/isomerase [Spirosoma fluminis]